MAFIISDVEGLITVLRVWEPVELELRGKRVLNRTSDVQGSENTLYDTIMIDTCRYTFVQTHRLYSTKNEW